MQQTSLSKPHVTEKRAELVNRRETLIQKFSQAARSDKEGRLKPLFRGIVLTNEFIESLDRIAAETKPKRSETPRFTVSSLFLHNCFKNLTADRSEQFVFITGSEVEGVLVLDQMIELAHEKRTALGVKADIRSTHGILIKLEQFKHRLLAHFHSHPGTGPDSTLPSGTDTDFQRRLESAGHIAVAAIFSRDGYVRFLRLDKQFEIDIFGEGVEKHDANIFRITNLD